METAKKNIKKDRTNRKDREQKKWTDAEVNKILDFLSENRNFEVSYKIGIFKPNI